MEPLLGLPVVLPQSGSRLLLISLHNQLRTAILDGRLKPGVRLPSTRALAEGLRIGRNTAVAAYELLLGEGYLVVRRGSGTAVAELLPSRSNPAAEAARRGLQRRLNRYWRHRTLPQRRQAGAPPRYNFQVGAPDAANFPYDIWRRLGGRIERRLRGGFPLAADAQGLPALREAIAQHVSFARAVACGPQDIVVTAGAHQAFDLLARILTTAGRTTVAIENPGYPPVREAFAAHGARIAPVPVDAEGLIVGNIPAAARVVCVTPSHQFPLGAVMSARRRTALLDACSRRRAVIIEDDYDGEFRFADRPLDALQTLDRMGSVFYVGTFSKSLLPDLRLGYVVAPPWALGALVAAKRVADGQSSAMTQATVALLIRDGHLARHIRKMQRIYRGRRDRLLEGLRAGFDRWLEVLPSVAGLHVAARLKTLREDSVIARGRGAGVGIGALRPYYAKTPTMGGLMFGYGNLDERSIDQGLELFRASIASV
ncbi:MAG TPA: PLP-dependent aminotransferase family protein [Steroidobacteraceae bacterium]|nr:PLP-dependent aminotransferase family protein [Steroidobacteraceae bacterium]